MGRGSEISVTTVWWEQVQDLVLWYGAMHAAELRAAVHAQCGVTCSAGVARS